VSANITGAIALGDRSPDRLADWLEKEAIQNGYAAVDDLVQAVRIEDAAEDIQRETGEWDRGSEAARGLADAAWISIQKRRRWIPESSGGYPFTLDGTCLRAVKGAESSAYGFLLGLNYVPYEPGTKGQRMAKVFEHLCCYAAERYLGEGAASHAFGWPRTDKVPGFIASINKLCASMGEGTGFSNKIKPKQVKDDGLDVVAWKAFPGDNRIGKMVLFGQCATGRRWDNKVSDLNADAFMRCWFTDTPSVLNLFFVPEIVSDEDQWKQNTYNAGIIFDRCRIAAMAGLNAGGLNKQWEKWSSKYLRIAA